MMKTIVCVPVYNEENTITRTISSIFSQTTHLIDDLVLVVIASGCTDNTVPNVKKMIGEGYPIRLYEESVRSGKASALNSFFADDTSLEADIVVFTDGDVILASGAFDALVQEFTAQSGLDIVTGHPIPLNSENEFWGKVAKENCEIWNQTRIHLMKTKEVWPLSGYLFAMKPNALPDVIPKEFIAEDAFIGLNAMKYGFKLGYAQAALVKVMFPENLLDYYRQKSRTRSGWRQIRKNNFYEYDGLRNVQNIVIKSRVKSGNMYSVICWLLDKTIWKLDWLLSHFIANRNIWKQVASTKRFNE